MSRQIYNYHAAVESARAGSNAILEAVNQDSGEKAWLCEWPAARLDVSLKRRFQEIASAAVKVEYFTDGGCLYVASPDLEALKATLEALRSGGLFTGDWPGLIDAPPSSPSVAAMPKKVAEPPEPRPKPSRTTIVALAATAALALALAVGWEVHRVDSEKAAAAVRQVEQRLDEERKSAGEQRKKAEEAERERKLLMATRLSEERARAANEERVRPTFDCNKAATASEKLICRDNDLARSERSMVEAYQSALASLTGAARVRYLSVHVEWFKRYARECNGIAARGASDSELKACVGRYLDDRATALRDLAK